MKLGKRTRVLLIVIVAVSVGMAIGFKARKYFPIESTYMLSVYDASADITSYKNILYGQGIPNKWMSANNTVDPLVLEKGNLPKNREFKLLYSVECVRGDFGSVHSLILASGAGSESILVSSGNGWHAVASVLNDLPYRPLGSKEPLESIKCYKLEIKEVAEALEHIKQVAVGEVR